MLHAGPTLLSASLNHRFHVIYLRKTVRSITRQCVTCRCQAVRPQPQMMGQLPLERTTPGCVFEKVEVDYAGPFHIQYDMVRKPTLVKHMSAFLFLLPWRWSIWKLCLIWHQRPSSQLYIASLLAVDTHPSSGVIMEQISLVLTMRLKELYEFLTQQKTEGVISEFRAARNVEWRFRGPNFGGLWEAAVKSAKTHFKCIIWPVKFTWWLHNSSGSGGSMLEQQTIGSYWLSWQWRYWGTYPLHFLIGQPLCALPDSSISFRSTYLHRCWHLCQNVIRHFWQMVCWISRDSNKFNKWHYPSRNLAVGDVVLLKEASTIPTLTGHSLG